MKSLHRLLIVVGMLSMTVSIQAQATAAAAGGFQVTKITKSMITTPQYSYSGAQQYQANQREQWLEVEVEFASTVEVADELSLKYFVAINGKVLTGEVTHTNVAAGKGIRSVMYIPPHVLTRFNLNRPVTPTAVQNIAVQIVQQGTVKDEASLTRAAAQWYTSLPQTPGFMLNKNETPFAPLYWDRYEQIKPASH